MLQLRLFHVTSYIIFVLSKTQHNLKQKTAHNFKRALGQKKEAIEPMSGKKQPIITKEPLAKKKAI